MLTWDEILLNGRTCLDSVDIYNQAPISRFDSRFKVTLSRRRYDCLLHHDKWTNHTTSVINTLSHTFSENNAPIFTDISIDNGIKQGACSCRKYTRDIKEPNLPEDVIIEETEDLKIFFFNIFNMANQGPGLTVIKQPLLDILQQCAVNPDLQSYMFLRWMRNILTVALIYKIQILKPEETVEALDEVNEPEREQAERSDD